MKEGYKQVWIKVSTYDKLKKLSKNSGKSIVRLIEEFVDGVSETKGFDESVIRRIVREEVTRVLDEIKAMLYNIVEKCQVKVERKKSFIEAVREAFLGEREPLTLKKVPIQISKGNIFVESVTELDLDLSKFKARVVEEPNEKGETIGLSIVPDIGFENMSLEEWFDEYGSNLIKELLSKLSKP